MSLFLLIITVIVNDVTDAIYYSHIVTIERKEIKKTKRVHKCMSELPECEEEEIDGKVNIHMYIICYYFSLLWWSFQLRYCDGDTDWYSGFCRFRDFLINVKFPRLIVNLTPFDFFSFFDFSYFTYSAVSMCNNHVNGCYLLVIFSPNFYCEIINTY